MSVTLGSLVLAVSLASGPQSAGGRLLLCRPKILGEPSQARAEAMLAAAKLFGDRFLDYGVFCDTAAEGARAARGLGLDHAVVSSAEGRSTGNHFVLSLTEAKEASTLASREVNVATGADPVAPLQSALDDFLKIASSSPGPRQSSSRGWGPWYLVAGGVVALAAGGAFALAARSATNDRGQASSTAAGVQADARWRHWRTASSIALGAGGLAVVAGLTWRFAF